MVGLSIERETERGGSEVSNEVPWVSIARKLSSQSESDEIEDEGECPKKRPSRRYAFVRGVIGTELDDAVGEVTSTRNGVAPRTTPSLRVDRSKRVRA